MMRSVLFLILVGMASGASDCPDSMIIKASYRVYCDMLGVLCTACPFFIVREVCSWILFIVSVVFSLYSVCNADLEKCECLVLFIVLAIASFVLELTLVLLMAYGTIKLVVMLIDHLYCLLFNNLSSYRII